MENKQLLEEIGKRVNARRKALGYTQEQLAKLTPEALKTIEQLIDLLSKK